ncbi:MAG TPA: hypothetical protein VGG75_40875 [Trebonia sp.]
MKVKQIVTYLIVAFLVWFVIKQPGSAGHIINNIGTFLSTAASGFGHFISSI